MDFKLLLILITLPYSLRKPADHRHQKYICGLRAWLQLQLNPALLTLCHPHWLANVRISSFLVLTKIVNNSLQSLPACRRLLFPLLHQQRKQETSARRQLKSGLFPDIWKEALVFSLLKKPGLDVIFKNFRPVNNLSFFPKLIERAAFNQIHGHLVNLYPAAQSAYRRNHSTETALLKVTNDILSNTNTHHVTVLVCIYCFILVLLSIPLITSFSLTDYHQNLV